MKRQSLFSRIGGSMGSYSYFSYENIKVVDKQGLFDWLMSVKDDNDYEEFMYGDYLIDTIDGKDFSFDNWTDIKLISYWYDSQIKFLDKISDFIEGEVHWDFENADEGAYVEFKNGKTIFNIGRMRFEEFKATDLLKEKNI